MTIKVSMIEESLLIDDEADDIEKNRPPKDEPNTALICSLGNDQFIIIEHTGRYFYSQIEEVGFQGEEVGCDFPPEDEPGFWVFENGKYWSSTDWETGVVDDYGISGTYRRPTKEDFKKFGREDLILEN